MERNHLGSLVVDGRHILKYISKQYVVKMQSGFN
jgi:hypothetical protein